MLKNICVLINYVEHPDTASYSWEYQGGCFANGDFAHYAPAEIGQQYDFDNINVEVRQSYGSFTEEMTNSTGVSMSFFGLLGLLSLFGSLGVALFAAFTLYTALKSE